MILIADASPLIALSLCDQLNLLEILFDEIALPEAVFNELIYQTNLKQLKS